MKRTFATLVACFGLTHFGLALAQSNDTLAKIKETRSITIGARDSQSPFSYKTSGTSDPIGYTNDICLRVVDAIKKRLNLPAIEVRYVMMNSTNRIPLIQNGTADLDCASTTNTEARQQQVDFAPSHFVAGITAAVRRDSGIKTLADLKGRTVATVSGSTSIQLLRAYERAGGVEVQEVFGKDTVDAFLSFTSGRAAAIVLDDIQLAALIANSRAPADYVLLKESLREEPYGIMYRKHDPQFKEIVDGTVAAIMKSGEIDRIYAKWFTQPIPPSNINLNFPQTESIRGNFRSPNSKGV